jgi:hypothetical protein
VSKVEIEARLTEAGENEIVTAVHIEYVPTPEQGEAIAADTHNSALNRLSFDHGVAIEDGRVIGREFFLIAPPPSSGTARVPPVLAAFTIPSPQIKLHLPLDPSRVKGELERVDPRERYFPLFRSALLSPSPVEEFLHLYNILLMLFGDTQTNVDKFILSENPSVPLTSSPFKKDERETVYTRLRNEFAHARGVNLNDTKAEMKMRVGELVGLTKRAIELRA